MKTTAVAINRKAAGNIATANRIGQMIADAIASEKARMIEDTRSYVRLNSMIRHTLGQV